MSSHFYSGKVIPPSESIYLDYKEYLSIKTVPHHKTFTHKKPKPNILLNIISVMHRTNHLNYESDCIDDRCIQTWLHSKCIESILKVKDSLLAIIELLHLFKDLYTLAVS